MSCVSRVIVKDEAEVIKELCNLVENSSNESIEKRGSFHIGLSGGSLAKFLSTGLPSIKTTWENWTIYFCDERLVPVSDADSTLKLYLDGLMDKVPLTQDQFIVVNTELPVEEAAKDYEDKIKLKLGNVDIPVFDLLLLGMGPDGHTASLFPGHKLLDEKTRWISPISDSPKPPPCRVTMTLPVINAARQCAFAMAGSGKADMVKRILMDKEPLPAGLVRPTSGKLSWILDQSAASKLK